uniref:Glyoxalase domain containing 4 n=1 Tax=Urocitellus parryii TaxID=9999 RepID=A0A8D2I6T7_UROPR
MAGRRALHFVFKVGNRFQTTHFFRDVLGMKVLRHEEFEEGCKAACNGRDILGSHHSFRILPLSLI